MIQIQSTVPRAELEEEVNQEIEKFSDWFQSLGNGPLVKSEIAILKTYFAWRLGVNDVTKTGG